MSKKQGSVPRAWTPESVHRETRRRIERAKAGNRSTLHAFAKWLVRTRGLCPGTIAGRLGSACSFLDGVTGRAGTDCTSAIRSLSCDDIEEFFVRYGVDRGMSVRRSMQAAMRHFLTFAAELGWVGLELKEAVPMLRSYRLSGLPRGLRDEQLETLLTASWEGAQCPRRDRAIIYLLSTYGVRRGQVSALRFEDLDWHARTVDFGAHKGGKAIHHELTAAVGEALAEYLRSERPASCCPHVFLRHRRPHLQLNPAAITSMVRYRMMRCGLPPRSPHAFRHNFATRLLRAGQTPKVISDLLGHRSLDAVAIYAKVDYERLLQCAVDWPEARS